MSPILSNRWGFSFLSTCITLFAIVLIAFATMIWQLPSVKTLADSHLQAPLRIYTKQGDLIAEFGEKQRIPTPLSAIPKKLIQAILSTEDQRFYQHNGVDMLSLARAAHSLIVTGEKRQGASTITMQVARNFFLTRHKTFLRKFREILLAIKLEQYLTKDEILTLYLNKIYFGMRAYGVAAAARNYYGKDLHELTLAQMAMIAGLPQAPSSNNPIVNPKKAIERRNHVLRKMFEQKTISHTEYIRAKNAPITASRHGARIVVKAPYVAEMVREQIVAMFGKEEAYNEGFSVYTTIDAKQQIVANKALVDGLFAYDKRHGFKSSINLAKTTGFQDITKWVSELTKYKIINNLTPAVVLEIESDNIKVATTDNLLQLSSNQASWALNSGSFSTILKPGDLVYLKKDSQGVWQLDQLPKVQGALISMEVGTGFITSLVGGFSQKLSYFNRATQASRQSGSCFKPFIYSAALDKGVTVASIFNDAPVVLPSTGENLLWRPQNSNNQFYGPTSLREGLIHSRNLVSIRILRDIGVEYTSEYIKRFGFINQPRSLSLALGSGSVTPLDLTAAYAVFANSGYKVKPIIINSITNQSGRVIFNSNTDASNRIIPSSTAFLVADMLRDVIKRGSGKRARVLNRADIAGKTGTTNKKIDAWFVGFSPKLVTSVWVGFDQLEPLHEYGSKAALPIWIDFMRQALPQKKGWLKIPENIIQIKVDPLTGKRSDLASAKLEYFTKDNYPKEELATTNQELEELY
jgi:penicillin-binding protein 1A